MRGDELDRSPTWASYEASLRDNLPFNRVLNRRILQEIADHKQDATERLLARGMTPVDAEREAIEQLGRPRDVAVAFARSRGLGMASNTTRLAGLAGACAPFLLLAGFFLVNTEGGDPVHWVGGGLMIASLGLLVSFLYGMWRRHAGTLGIWGKSATWLAALTVPLSLPFGWGAPIAMMGYLAGSFVLLGIGVWRSNTLQARLPLVLCAAGPLWMLAIGWIGALADFDGARYFGLGMIPTTIGLVWLGATLWNEPLEEGGSSDLPAMA